MPATVARRARSHSNPVMPSRAGPAPAERVGSIVLVFTGNHEGSARDQNPVNVGFFSYLIACAAYLVLTTLLLISWRGRALGSLAIGASRPVAAAADRVPTATSSPGTRG